MKSKAKSKRVAIALLVVFSILSAVFFFIAFGVTEMGKIVYDECNTIEYMATYRRMEETHNSKGNLQYHIYLEGYDCIFLVYDTTLVSKENLEGLEQGTAVTFRIWDIHENLIEEHREIYIPFITFNVGESEIVSFESSNREETSKRTKAKIAGIVAAVTFLAGAGICIIKLVKLKKQQ